VGRVRKKRGAVQIQLLLSQENKEEPWVIQSFAKDLFDGDDVGREFNEIVRELYLRLQSSGWSDAATQRVIAGPAPLKLVKGKKE
jgi:hypothetical protein